MTRTGVVKSMKDFYWDIRPKPEYGTIEVRVFDTPLTIERAAALASATFAGTLATWLTVQRSLQRPRWWVAPASMAGCLGATGAVLLGLAVLLALGFVGVLRAWRSRRPVLEVEFPLVTLLLGAWLGLFVAMAADPLSRLSGLSATSPW